MKKIFSKLFKPANNANEDHAVIIHFNYLTNDLKALQILEGKLERAIQEKKAGEYDGHEIATDYSDGFLYMYGPNAENLFKSIKPILEETDFTKGATARLIFGTPGSGATELEVEI
jgi:hypothetical protein